MGAGRIQKLLLGEYDDFEDIVLLDSAFVEITKVRKGIRQVYLGITAENFIVAVERPLDYRKYPQIYRSYSLDSDLDGVELQWLVPLCFVKLHSRSAFCINVDCKGKRTRYFELNTNVDRDYVWRQWIERLGILQDDNYGVKREQRLKYGVATIEDLDYVRKIEEVSLMVPKEPIKTVEQRPKQVNFSKAVLNRVQEIRKPKTYRTKKPDTGSILKLGNPVPNKWKSPKPRVRFKKVKRKFIFW